MSYNNCGTVMCSELSTAAAASPESKGEAKLQRNNSSALLFSRECMLGWMMRDTLLCSLGYTRLTAVTSQLSVRRFVECVIPHRSIPLLLFFLWFM